MLAGVLEDVEERVAGFAGSLDDVEVVAIAQDRSGAREVSIDRLGQAPDERLDARRSGNGVRGLDQEMDVIPLDAEFHDPEEEAERALA